MIRCLMIRILALATLLPAQLHVCQAAQNVVVVLDDSGSMKETMRTPRGRVRRIDAAKQALAKVLSSLTEDTQVGVLALNTQIDGSNWVVPLGSTNPERWRARVSSIQAEGGTPLGQFIRNAADELLKLRAVERYGMYRMLVVTDGEANDTPLLDAILPDVLSRGLVMDVIGVDMKAEHSLASRAHSYRRADDEQSLEKAISEVFAETSGQDQDSLTDFDLLAGLPDEFAIESLLALSRVGNNPIGTSVSIDESGQPVINVTVPAGPNAQGGRSTIGDIFSWFICCLGTLFSLVVLICVLLKGSAKRKRS